MATVTDGLPLLRDYIQSVAPVPDAEVAALAHRLRARSLEPGEPWLRAGEPATTLGFIVRGLVKVYYARPDGREHIRIFHAEGSPVADYASLLSGTHATVNVRTVEASTLLEIDGVDFQGLYRRHRAWETFGRRVAEHFMIVRERREYQLLMLSAAERYEVFIAEHPDLLARLPQYEIASYLGITAVSLSRIRAGRSAPGS